MHVAAATKATSRSNLGRSKVNEPASSAYIIEEINDHGSAADDFQVRDLCQVGQILVLHAVSEIAVLLIATQIFKRQYRDAFFGSN